MAKTNKGAAEEAAEAVAEKEVEICDTVLLEMIYNLRFVDKDGKFFRLDDYKAGGVYILRPA